MFPVITLKAVVLANSCKRPLAFLLMTFPLFYGSSEKFPDGRAKIQSVISGH